MLIHAEYLPDPADAPAAAIVKQRQWAEQVREEPLLLPVRTLAAVDVHLGATRAIAVAALVTFPALAPVTIVSADAPLAYPYVPGLLSWREAPAAVAALEQLPAPPDVLIADGHGRAHPRRFGLACHLGLITGLPTIGCAKSVLVGRYETLAEAAGSVSPLVHHGEVVGMALHPCSFRSGIASRSMQRWRSCGWQPRARSCPNRAASHTAKRNASPVSTEGNVPRTLYQSCSTQHGPLTRMSGMERGNRI